MKRILSTDRQGKCGPIISLSESKRLSHLSGIRIVKNGKIPADIAEDTEIYDLSNLPRFSLCACYLGYTSHRVLGEDNVRVSFSMIWDLSNFLSCLGPRRDISDLHGMMIEKSFELLGFQADLSIREGVLLAVNRYPKIVTTEGRKTKCLGFDIKGINADIFSQMLMHALDRNL